MKLADWCVVVLPEEGGIAATLMTGGVERAADGESLFRFCALIHVLIHKFIEICKHFSTSNCFP